MQEGSQTAGARDENWWGATLRRGGGAGSAAAEVVCLFVVVYIFPPSQGLKEIGQAGVPAAADGSDGGEFGRAAYVSPGYS